VTIASREWDVRRGARAIQLGGGAPKLQRAEGAKKKKDPQSGFFFFLVCQNPNWFFLIVCERRNNQKVFSQWN